MSSLASPVQLQGILKKYNFRFRKNLGQNFLVDGNIIRKIVSALHLSSKDVVVEIGSGAGTLTRVLAQHAGMVIALEVDQRLSPVLKETLGDLKNVEIVYADALKVDFNELIRKYSPSDKPYKIAANLPYYITTPLLIYLMRKKFHFSRLVVMLQREVASRLTACHDSRDYGALTVITQFYTEPKVLFRVPRTVFIPQPEVDSAVICLTRREKPLVEVPSEELFFNLVRSAFGKRRKILLNALASSTILPRLSRQEWEEILRKAGIEPRRRGESLSIEEFALLTQTCWTRISINSKKEV